MRIKYYVILVILSLILTNCASNKQRSAVKRSLDSAQRVGRGIEKLDRDNHDTYSKIDNFFYILDDTCDTIRYAKEGLEYTKRSVSQSEINEMKEISAYFTANDPYPDNKKDLNYCKNVGNFFSKVIELKNQNIPKSRVKMIIENNYTNNKNSNFNEGFNKKRSKITNITINKIYKIIEKTDPSAAKMAFKQGCLEVDLR
jgi:hypothetical protein